MRNPDSQDEYPPDRHMRLRPPHDTRCGCSACAGERRELLELALDEAEFGDDEVRRPRPRAAGATGMRGAPGKARVGAAQSRPRPMGKPRPASAKPQRWARKVVQRPALAAPVCNCPTHGTEFTRWVQSTLNRLQSVGLAVDGVMSPTTRSALRAFQEQQGLPADGIAGPDTERALIDAGTGSAAPSTDAPATADAPDEAATPQEFEAFDFDELEFEWESEVSRSSREYIMWVQRSLNKLLGLTLAVDGISGTMTKSAVRDFQARQGLQVDGIVGSQTEAALVRAGAGVPPGTATGSPTPYVPWPSPAPSAPTQPAPANKLSGVHWVDQFPTSRSTDSLVEPFRSNVNRFLAALRSAGASVVISATRRPAERAWLMHYAWMIAEEGMSPAAVPRHPSIDIQWVHTDANGNVNLAASRAAAEDMVGAYALKYEPALESRHIDGKAIDKTITWGGNLAIRDGKGSLKTIASTPRTGSDNRELHAVGASYGVIKLVSDPPHWSDTGH